MSTCDKQMLELATKNLTECQELEQVEEVRNIEHQENIQYIEECIDTEFQNITMTV